MTKHKAIAQKVASRPARSRAARSRAAPKVVSPRNKVNVAMPLSMFTIREPAKMTVGDWISLAELAISVTGFSVVIWQSIRAARGPQPPAR